MQDNQQPSKYQEGKIYKIVSGDKTYYGSTCQKYLSHRLADHKRSFVKGLNKFSSKILFEENQEPEIFLVESWPCNSVDELRARERFYIENNDCINKNKPGRTASEWYSDNRDRLIVKMRDRYYRIKAELEADNIALEDDNIAVEEVNSSEVVISSLIGPNDN